uniref:Uncharacterized protein n=1 Tax=viral metagenome TaxID=1070528 RepID=A0A6C0DY44_9ZZZZ
MSSSGINAINSGPLIIRSYLGSSSNNTYALGANDIPISSNRVLITSTNGLVVLSDNIYVSSITVSSINGGGGGGNDVYWSSTLNNGGIVNTNTGNVNINSTLSVSSIVNVPQISTFAVASAISTAKSYFINYTADIGNGPVYPIYPVLRFNSLKNGNQPKSLILTMSDGNPTWISSWENLEPTDITNVCANFNINSNSTITQQFFTSTINTSTINATGPAISRVATSTIVSDPTSSGWINYLGKYCFVNGDTIPTLTLPTAGDVPPDGTIIVIRNIGVSGNITVNNVVGGTSIILSGRTTSFIYTTTVTTGWYTL